MAKILIAEDAEFMRLRVAQMLSAAGYQALEAENGRIAVEVYKGSRPELVLMDIAMPELGGLAALRAIRDFDPGAKIVMLSALGQEPSVLEAMEAGANDFIIKPFERDRVFDVISALLDTP